MRKISLVIMTLAISLAAAGEVFYEDFRDAPNLSEGWTYGEMNNVKLGNYDGQNSQYRDKVTSAVEDCRSLKIERPGKLVDGVSPLLEIISPQTIENVRQYSFYCKRTTGDTTSDTISVYGRSNDAAEWIPLGEPIIVTTSNRWLTNSVPDSLGIHEIKFSFSAEPSSVTFQNCAIDSLRVLTGEDAPSDDDDPVGPAEPTKPTNLKIEATAPDQIQATWQGVPGEDGYWVELFRSVDSRETEAPDFSGLEDGNWPVDWTHSSENGLASYSDGATRNVKILYSDAWIVSRSYSRPVTAFSCKFLSHSQKAGELAGTKLVIETSSSETNDDWVELEKHPISTSTTNLKRELDDKKNVRRLRFSILYEGDDRDYAANLLIEFRVLSVTWGRVESTSEGSCSVAKPAAVFSRLDATGSYFVTVQPTPSEEPELVATSDVLDLSKEHFRETGALPLTLKNLTCEERFDSLSNFVSQTKTAKMSLDYWQFVKDGAEMDSLALSQTNTASQDSGCYVCRDKERISDIDSAMIGTLASGDKGCAVGLALRNDTDRILKGPKVTFDSMQRSSNVNPSTYAFEWRIADGETSIAAGSDWRQVDIPPTAPIVSEKRTALPECRQRDSVAAIPAKLPAGKVLLIRWRHPATKSGPMMAIDNVRIAFDRPGGFLLLIR